MKKNFIIGLIITGLGVSFLATAQKAVRVQGTITGLEDNAVVILKKTDNSNSRPLSLDTTRASQGRFEFSRTVPETDFYSVLVQGLPGQVQFLWDDNVTIEGTREAFREAQVKGSPLTNEWKKFQDEVEFPYRDILMNLYNERQRSANDTTVANRVVREEKRLRQEQYQKVQEHIRANPKSLLSLYLLNWYWPQFSKAEARTLYEQLDGSYKNHSVAKRLQNQLK